MTTKGLTPVRGSFTNLVKYYKREDSHFPARIIQGIAHWWGVGSRKANAELMRRIVQNEGGIARQDAYILIYGNETEDEFVTEAKRLADAYMRNEVGSGEGVDFAVNALTRTWTNSFMGRNNFEGELTELAAIARKYANHDSQTRELIDNLMQDKNLLDIGFIELVDFAEAVSRLTCPEREVALLLYREGYAGTLKELAKAAKSLNKDTEHTQFVNPG